MTFKDETTDNALPQYSLKLNYYYLSDFGNNM